MKTFHRLMLSCTAIVTSLVTSCAPATPTPNPEQAKVEAAGFVNPHPEGTYAHFLAEPSYPKTSKSYRNQDVLSRTNASNSRLVISIAKQRGFLMNGDEVAIDYPVSTGRKKYPTPPGSYRIVEKMKDKRSNLYGKIYDADGKLVNADADTKTDTVPEGGKYVGASMPYWMRFTWDGIGHHVGRVPRYPASHGCIRGHRSVLSTVFSKVKVGTPAIIE